MGMETAAAVGLDEALAAARLAPPDVVLCDYDLLASVSIEGWERDELLSRRPVIAVSLTRRPHEQPALDVNAIAGCLYLPTLKPDDARRVLAAAARRVPSYSFGVTPDACPRAASPARGR